MAGKNPRVNEEIQIESMRVIDQTKNQLGVLSISGALAIAREAELDLVEVDPTSEPPVCRIMDYGKFIYERKKKEHKSRLRQPVAKLKEVRLRPKIDTHDRQVKVDQARKFLEKGSRIQFTMIIRGREAAHMEIPIGILEQIADELDDVGEVESFSRRQGHRMTMIMASTKVGRPKTGGMI